MCATCGCSATGVGLHLHGSDHDHAHFDGVGHDHAHDGGGHDHGPGPTLVNLERDVLAKNDRLARDNRAWLASRGILALNLVSSPGAGKTTLLERTIREIGRDLPVSVIEGDQETSRDADRIRAAGARATQINTGRVCHLDALMVGDALRQLDPPTGSVLFIENVGNLVCPALFDLGEHAKVVLASVPEGEDKPIKYPHMFRASDVMLLTKVDLLPHVSFDVTRCLGFAREVNPRLQVLLVSATRGDGLGEWYRSVRMRAAAAPRPLSLSR
jgi:hydrogenase nickel incorporation protein HypB